MNLKRAITLPTFKKPRKHPGVFVAEPGTKLAETWKLLVANVRIRIVPGHWVYDVTTKKTRWVEPVFFSYIDYGVTSAWFGD